MEAPHQQYRTGPSPSGSSAKGLRRTALACSAVVAGMTGLAFASVPLYDLFCKATGYDGTPRTGVAMEPTPDAKVLKPLAVRFDTNVAPGLAWRFRAETGRVSAVPGETKTVFFTVKNTGSEPATGIATFNVQPGLMGSYFVKVQCFCFEEHTLQPGESMDVPLAFYIDPKLRQDDDILDLEEMTLSYTYFASKNAASATRTSGTAEAPAKARDRTSF